MLTLRMLFFSRSGLPGLFGRILTGCSILTATAFTSAEDPCLPARCIPLTVQKMPLRPASTNTELVSHAAVRRYNRVFILGNSITTINITPADQPLFGWTGNWGMAASAPEKDYYTILSNRLRAQNPLVQINSISGGGFERGYDVYNFEQSLDEHITNQPDLLIVRISENINDPSVLATDKARTFETAYNQLLDYLLSKAAPNARVVCTTSFWNHPNASAVIRRVAGQRGFALADLSVLYGRPEYMATQYQSVNTAVAEHPNDAGMAQIADLIWDQLK